MIPEFRLEVISETESTNTALLSRKNSIHGVALLADRQIAGHGRRGRGWDAPEGSLALSLGFEFSSKDAKSFLPRIPFLAGVAVYNTLHIFAPHANHIALKWPNDIMLGKKKLGGLLVEARQAGEHVRAALGIGINLQAAPKIHDAASFLETAGLQITPAEFAKPFLATFTSLAPLLNDFSELRNAWEERCAHRNAVVFYGDRDHPESMRKAKTIKLCDDGTLLVRDEAYGKEVNLISEDTSLRVQ